MLDIKFIRENVDVVQKAIENKNEKCDLKMILELDEKKRKQMEAFLNPSSIAVIGASDRIGSWGSIIMESLQRWNFPGKLYPVNHNADTVSGIKAYPNIQAVPEKVDLAILAVPAESIPETIRGCGEKVFWE